MAKDNFNSTGITVPQLGRGINSLLNKPVPSIKKPEQSNEENTNDNIISPDKKIRFVLNVSFKRLEFLKNLSFYLTENGDGFYDYTKGMEEALDLLREKYGDVPQRPDWIKKQEKSRGEKIVAGRNKNKKQIL